MIIDQTSVFAKLNARILHTCKFSKKSGNCPPHSRLDCPALKNSKVIQGHSAIRNDYMNKTLIWSSKRFETQEVMFMFEVRTNFTFC
jgi:hypothetical protein